MKRPKRKTVSARPNVELLVDDLAPGGEGVGHVVLAGQSRAVFMPRVALGDRLEVEVDRRPRPARGRVLRIMEPGPGRVQPPCPHVVRCGACDWMHLSSNAQRSARESHLKRALPKVYQQVPVSLHDAPAALGYRTRARLHVRASGGRAIVGPYASGSREVVDVGSCAVLSPRLDEALPAVASLLEGAHGVGEVSLALGSAGRPVLELRWDGQVPAFVFSRLERAVVDGTLSGGTVYGGEITRPATVGDPTPRMRGADGHPFRLAPGGFAQASEEANVALVRRVSELARSLAGAPSGERSRASVLELYSGAGNFTILLARDFDRVTAIESSLPACEAARDNLKSRGLYAKITCADADTFAVPARTDLVVLDPPRRGARLACAALVASGAKAVVYVSCDSPTLGRDLGMLADRYDVVSVDSFAMFPGTSHSETVVALRQRCGGRA